MNQQTEKARSWTITLRESGVDGCTDLELRHPTCKCALGDSIPDDVAEYVYRAVNSHDDLLSLLKRARCAIAMKEAWDHGGKGIPGEPYTPSEFVAEMDAAIARAKGGAA